MATPDSNDGATGDPRARTVDIALLAMNPDRSQSIPAFQQLKFHVIHAISTARLRPGDVMPSVREAADALGVSPATIQRAYGELKREGYLSSSAGRHTFVADIDVESSSTVGRDSALHDLLMPAYVSARALGFSDSEIVTALSALTSTAESPVDDPVVLFVGPIQVAVDKYTRILSDHLGATGTKVAGATLEQFLAAPEDVLGELGRVATIVTVVSSLSAVREAADPAGVPTCSLLVDLTEQTKRTLAELPFDARIAVISEAHYLSNTVSTIRQMCGDGVEIVAIDEGGPEAEAALAGCDIYFHTLSTKALAAELVPPDGRAEEFSYTALKASLDHIDEIARASRRPRVRDDAAGPVSDD